MKIDVIQAKDAKFKRFSYWSDWIDIAVFQYDYTPFLLQMRVNRFNKKKFKSIRISGLVYRQFTPSDIGDLTQMGKANKTR